MLYLLALSISQHLLLIFGFSLKKTTFFDNTCFAFHGIDTSTSDVEIHKREVKIITQVKILSRCEQASKITYNYGFNNKN